MVLVVADETCQLLGQVPGAPTSFTLDGGTGRLPSRQVTEIMSQRLQLRRVAIEQDRQDHLPISVVIQQRKRPLVRARILPA